MNPDEPELPAPLHAAVRSAAATERVETHPSAEVLARYDEEPAGLSPRTRQWIDEHLATCAACGKALQSVPRLGLPTRAPGRRLWPLAAAAGWILAAWLGLGRLREHTEPTPFLAVHSLVLSAPRGGAPTAAPPEARFLRCQLVLGEDVPLGTHLRVYLEGSDSRGWRDEAYEVVERNERDWPVLTLDRAQLPRGTVSLRVVTPSGLESVFELEL